MAKVTFSMQPRFLFRHLSIPLLLLALRLPGVSASALGEGAAAAGETDEERLRPGTLGALLGGD